MEFRYVVGGHRAVVYERHRFEIVFEAAVIHVRRTHGDDAVVDDDRFGVQEPVAIAVNGDSRLDAFADIGVGGAPRDENVAFRRLCRAVGAA